MQINISAKINSKHDFGAKIRQSSLFPYLKRYITWQRVVRGLNKGESSVAPEWLMPISINLDLTTACNYRCAHCVDLETLNQKINYDYQNLISSLGNLIRGGLRSVIIIGGGEPTIHPKFREVVRFLKERAVQLAIVSNGSRNDVIYDVASHFKGEDGDWVRLSLDAGTNETFAKMHKPARPISLEEICSWIPRIHEQNRLLSIGFSFIIVWEGAEQHSKEIASNVNEIVLAAKLARDYGFNYISFKPFLTRRENAGEVMDAKAISQFEQTLEDIREKIAEAKTLEAGEFRVIESTNLRVLMENSWQSFVCQPKVCHKQAFQQVLSPSGLINCPAWRGKKVAIIGDKDAYANEEKISNTQKALVAMLERFDASKNCAETTCLYNNFNWMIELAIKGKIKPEELTELEDRHDYYL